MSWKFEKVHPNSTTIDLSVDELLNNEKISIEQSLVRETIQNSLDAKRNPESREPVIVTFRHIQGVQGDSELVKSLWAGLPRHLELSKIAVEHLNFNNPGFLIVEDENTTGITGDYTKKLKGENWNGFFWHIGKSGKEGEAGGRRGVGRNVFAIASEIRSFIAVTLRYDDDKELMMGLSVLGSHYDKDGVTEYQPIGHYSRHPTETANPIDTPFENKELLASIKKLTGIERKRPGTSIIIPFPIQEVTTDILKRFTVQNYFLPIWMGELVVEIDGTVINQNNLVPVLESLDGSGEADFADYLEFVDDWRSMPEEEKIETFIPPSPKNDLEKSDFPEELLKDIKEKFSNGRTVAFRFPVYVEKKGAERQLCYVEAGIKRTPTGRAGRSMALRGNMPVINEGRIGKVPAYGILHAKDSQIVELLGDSEGSAHIDWNSKFPALKEKYNNYRHTIAFCQKVMSRLYTILSEADEEEDVTSFADYFPLPAMDSSSLAIVPDQSNDDYPEDIQDEREEDIHDEAEEDEENFPDQEETVIEIHTEDDLDPIPPKKPILYNITQKGSGFVVRAAANTQQEHFPGNIKIEVAYDMESGDPFKWYTPADFDFRSNKSLYIKEINAVVEAIAGNILIITANSPDFEVVIQGFDTNRDIRISDEQMKEAA